MILVKIYTLVPFLVELRIFLDWVCTDTTLTLWEWLKIEDISSDIYFTKCSRELEKTFPAMPATKKPMYVKILLGGTFILICVIIIWIPLALFALTNAVGISNVPIDVSVSLRIGSYEPIYSVNARDNIHTFSPKDFSALQAIYIKDKTAMTFLTGYDDSDIAAITLATNSPSLWGISPPDKERLLNELLQNHPITVRLFYSVSRIPPSKDVSSTVSAESSFEMDRSYPGRDYMIDMLQGKPVNESVLIPYIFPKFLKVKNSGELKTIPQLMHENKEYIGIKIKISKSSQADEFWWEVKENCHDPYYQSNITSLLLTKCGSNLVIYTFNDKKFPSTFSFLTAGGIIGMYTTFVIFASRFVRGFFLLNASRRIMFEDLPYVDRILQLCLDIYLVREAKEFALEEDLFAKLLFLYRSPETLIKWTRPKEEGLDEKDGTESVRSKDSVRSKESARRRD